MSTSRTMMDDQVAAIPFRWSSGRLEVALITRRQGKHWIVPKGNIEPGETPRRSALREATEEAGLLGRIGQRPFGAYEYRKGREARTVVVYLLEVTHELSSWSEDHVRDRKWLRVERAIDRVRERGLRVLLRGLAERLPA
jgi:8-oxo-dGTP pyrophosphatase MutT (NUDIX family)